MTDLEAVWSKISREIRGAVNPDTFQRWFKDLTLAALDENHATIAVPNHIFVFWIESNYLPLLTSAVTLVIGTPRAIRFVGRTPEENASLPDKSSSRDSAPEPIEVEETVVAPQSADSGMNPRNTFQTFVVGANNQFACAACHGVSQAPAKTYNPLFIYGGVGLGKTHLMHAIGHEIMGRKKGVRVLYLTSERFTNEFIDALQNNSLVKFRNRYRKADVLLIDDIQFLAGKERSQEEFFHTFNTLFDGHKQIVLSSDRPASEIQTLETRLVSRFEWGLTAELLPPDSETRVAILRKKAEAMEVAVNKDTLEFLAERIRTNVRRLEGALMRVASYISLNHGQTPTMERLEHMLKDLMYAETAETDYVGPKC